MITKQLARALPLVSLATALGCIREGDHAETEGPTGTAEQAVRSPPTYDEFIAPLGLSNTWASLPAGLNGTDITNTLQTMLTNLAVLAPAGGASAIYIPPGTYKISKTLNFVDGFGVTLVGDDPAT